MAELTKAHIEKLVMHFYTRVSKDNLLGNVFNEVANVNWDKHIPLLCQFWNSIMLKTGEYRGNAYAKHVLIGQQTTIKEIHFLHWLQLFQEEAVKHLPTEAANAITQRAALIAESLKQGMLT